MAGPWRVRFVHGYDHAGLRDGVWHGSLTFLDLFAGIGGFRLGMERAGHTCVGHIEIDKFAQQSYHAIFSTEGEFNGYDITSIDEKTIQSIESPDVITGGFPCQSFSIAGHRRGFDDTRGTLFFDIARFAATLQPKLLFLENVKGLLNHEQGETFRVILRTLDELGYDVEWQVLDSKDFGVPHSRERVFIIGHLRGQSTKKVFPFQRQSDNHLKFVGLLNMKGMESTRRVYSPDGISPTLTTMQGGNRQPKVIVSDNNTPRIRRLTGVSIVLCKRFFKTSDFVMVRGRVPRNKFRVALGFHPNFESVPSISESLLGWPDRAF